VACKQPSVSSSSIHEQLVLPSNQQVIPDLPILSMDGYLEGHLLIGNQKVIQKQNIKSLHQKPGCQGSTYHFNRFGKVKALYNISNNYTEWYYNSKGQLTKTENLQHTTKTAYYRAEYAYTKGKLTAKKETKFNDDQSIKSQETTTDSLEVAKYSVPFAPKTKSGNYYIDSTNRLIINFRKDLGFPCGVEMDSLNELTYYLKDNDLIDSLVIKNHNKCLTFKYVYEY